MQPSHFHPARCEVSPYTMEGLLQSEGGDDLDSASGQDDLCTPGRVGFEVWEVRWEDPQSLCV